MERRADLGAGFGVKITEEIKKKKIAVLKGGLSREAEVSRRSGKNVYESLRRQGCQVICLEADRDLARNLERSKIEAAFIALHGKYGEDGTVQGLLELLNIPYTGSGVLASALAMNKVACKKILRQAGIVTPDFYVLDQAGDPVGQARDIVNKLGCPVVIKPFSEGSSFGVTIVREPAELPAVLKKTQADFGHIFAEKYIAAQEVTVGILGWGKDLRALPVLELKPQGQFYDFASKYMAGGTEFIIPARLPAPVYQRTQAAALNAHLALGCHGFSRVDILAADGLPYVHDVNTIPGLTDLSDLPAQAQAGNISFDELIAEILASAWQRHDP